MYMVAYGNVVDGMSFVGPFLNHEDAVLHCDGNDSQWNIIELVSPPDTTAGSLASRLEEFADVLEDAATTLSQFLIGQALTGPSEEMTIFVNSLRQVQSDLRQI